MNDSSEIQYSYKFNILDETVSDSDLFQDKTHEKVADSLFELIDSSDKGVTIGLEGGWGAGKSTVINLLRSKFGKAKGKTKTLFFLFDAWAHDGDPLRRIFLESLINEIDPKKDDENLKSLKQEISGRKKTVEVKTKKSASKLGGLLSFSALFVPLGAAILSGIDYESFSLFKWRAPIHWLFIFSAIATSVPLLVLCYWFFWGEKDKNGFRGKKWDVFVSDSEESYTQDITEDGERTSIEFEDYFHKIMAHSIGPKKKYKKAIITIDNLDRVEPDQTLAIWSILQTFFQYRSISSNSDDAWKSQLWFLVPYDREGLSKVWDKANRDPRGDSDGGGVAQSFLEKCFQVVTDVPEPVLSGWVDYLKDTVKRSFVEWPDKTKDEVVETYQRFESRIESSPSPRQIQVFVNRVGMLGMRWKGEMSGEAMALYASLRKSRSDKKLRKDLIDKGLPENYVTTNSDEGDLKKQLAGMLFGVNKEKGIQLLLEPEIKAVLMQGKSKELRGLIATHDEAFWVVWQAIKDGFLISGKPEGEMLVITETFCDGFKAYKSRVADEISRLVDYFLGRLNWSLNTDDYSDALASLLKISSEEQQDKLLEKAKSQAEKALDVATNTVGEESFSPSLITNTHKLISRLGEMDISFASRPYENLDAIRWPAWLNAIKLQGIDFEFVLPAKGVVKELAAQINHQNPDDQVLTVLNKTFLYLPDSDEWNAVAGALLQFLQTQNSALGKDKAYSLMLNLYIRLGDDIKTTLRGGLNHQHFLNRVQRENIEQTLSLPVLCAVVFKSEIQSGDFNARLESFWQKELGEKGIETVLASLKKVEHLPVMWTLAKNDNNAVAIEIIRKQISLPDSPIYRSADGLLFVNEYTWASEEEQEIIITNSIEAGHLQAVEEPYVEALVVYRHNLKLLKKYGRKKGNDFVKKVLKKATAESWNEALSEDMVLFECIDDVGNHHFKDCIQEMMVRELESEEKTTRVWELFPSIYEKLLDKDEVVLAISKKYFELDVDPLNDEFFNFVSDQVLGQVAKVSPHDIVRRVDLWLKRSDWNRLEWVLKAELSPRIEPSEALNSRVNEMLGQSNGEHKGILINLAEKFNNSAKDSGETAND